MRIHEPVAVLRLGILESPSLVGTITHFYDRTIPNQVRVWFSSWGLITPPKLLSHFNAELLSVVRFIISLHFWLRRATCYKLRTKQERSGQNQISSSIPGTRPIDVFLSISYTDWKNTKLIVQILVVHVSMLILSLQCTEFNFSHGTKLLQGSAKASLLHTHPNGLKHQPLSQNGTVNTP